MLGPRRARPEHRAMGTRTKEFSTPTAEWGGEVKGHKWSWTPLCFGFSVLCPAVSTSAHPTGQILGQGPSWVRGAGV